MIDDLIGKPYKENGRGPDGYDCWGLAMEVYNRIGGKLPEQEELIKHKFSEITKPMLGDIVLIDACEQRHVGIMIDNKNFLSVFSQGIHNTVHQMGLSHPWVSNRIIGFYRYVGKIR